MSETLTEYRYFYFPRLAAKRCDVPPWRCEIKANQCDIVAWQFDNAVKQYGIAANWCEVTAIQCDIAARQFEIATNRCGIAAKRCDFYQSSFVLKNRVHFLAKPRLCLFIGLVVEFLTFGNMPKFEHDRIGP